MSSDSDSDLDFLAEIQTKKLNNKPNITVQNPDVIKQQFYEKLGENEILRSQLNQAQTEHQRHLGELLARQARDKEEHQKEIQEIKRTIERERIQHQFVLAELKMKNASNRPPPTITPVSEAHSTTKDNNTKHLTRLAPQAALGDGFVLKKPKIASSSASWQHATPEDSKTKDMTPKPPPLSSAQPDSSRLMSFLIKHFAPGFKESSMQLLFAYTLSGKKLSIGQDLSSSSTFGEFISKTIKYIEELQVKFDTNYVELLLSVLFDSLFLGLPFDSHQSNLSDKLCEFLLNWVKLLEPFPNFTQLLKTGGIRTVTARHFTCVLYALDVLLALDWDFEVPFELSRRMFSYHHLPNLCSRGIDLMAAHPHSEFDKLLTFQFPLVVPAEPHTELLFSGLTDRTHLTGAIISEKAKYSTIFSRFISNSDEILEYQATAQQLSISAFEYMQAASVRLANVLMSTCSKSPSLDVHVLGLLSGSVDGYILGRNKSVVEQSILYLWCRDNISLKQNLDSAGISELCVCLTKIVYGTEFEDYEGMVGQARQLLQILTSSEEVDRLYEMFEQYNEDELMIE